MENWKETTSEVGLSGELGRVEKTADLSASLRYGRDDNFYRRRLWRGLVTGGEKLQISPLRFAAVEMTIFIDGDFGEVWLQVEKNCRSLRFASLIDAAKVEFGLGLRFHVLWVGAAG